MIKTGLQILVTLMLVSPSVLFAEKRAADSAIYPNNPNLECPFTENTNVNINFNSREADLTQVNQIMDNRIKDIEDLAKKAGVEHFVLQSMNYSLNINNYGRGNCSPACDDNAIYQLNGSMSFVAFPSEKATDLMNLLNKKGYNGGLNVNRYRQCR